MGAIVRGNDDERVRRTLTWLQGVTEERAARYVAVNAGTVAEYRRSSGRTDEPRILLLVDNLAGFLKTYESNDVWVDRLVGSPRRAVLLACTPWSPPIAVGPSRPNSRRRSSNVWSCA